MEKNNLQNAIYNSEKIIKWGGILNEFLWICAGVDRKVLRQCPTDYAKYAGIGGTILFTALMAMLSGGYAMFSVFKDWHVAIGFGVFWGMLIFNLDRFIVNTMYSDGKVTISWNEFVCGLPRIVIAIFLGIVISTPLELKIFEDEINVVIKENIKNRIKEYEADARLEIDNLQLRADSVKTRKEELRNSPLDLDISSLSNDETINKLITSKKQKKADWTIEDQTIKSLKNQYYSLLKKRTHNDSIRAYAKNKEKLQHTKSQNALTQEINSIDAKLGNLSSDNQEIIKKAQKQRDKDLESFDKEISSINEEIEIKKKQLENDPFGKIITEEYGGFQAKMEAFSHMKENNPSTWWSSLFIMLLFIIIETAPTFFKMMIASGPYDDLLRAEMHRVKVLSEKRISDINDDINTAVQISVEKNRLKLEAEQTANRIVMEKLIAAQSELLEQAIEDWKRIELDKVKADPTQYIQSK